MKRIIIGIDPGTISLGYGIISVENNKIIVLENDNLNLGKKECLEAKLKTIFESIVNLIRKYNVTELAIEAPFFGKNVQSMLKLGKAQGVSIAAGLSCSLPFVEYTPKRVKQSITGNGNASKEQVASMLINMNYLTQFPDKLDATDALAVAICHYMQSSKIQTDNSTIKKGNSKKAYNSWATFASDNKDRII